MSHAPLGRRLGWHLVWLSTLGLLSWYYLSITPLRHLDSVFLFEAVESILRSGVPTSSTVASWPMVAPMFGWPVPQICSADLSFPVGSGYNVLNNHAYVALYPIALIASVLGVEPTFAVLNAAAHLALVLLPYLFLRRSGVGVLSAAAFSICVAAYPAWALSAVGDYYLDRLYMPFMLALLYLLHRCVQGSAPVPSRWLLIGVATAALAAAALTERAVIMVVATFLFFSLFFAFPNGRWRGQRWLYMGLPLLLMVYLACYFGFVYQGFEGGGSLRDNARISPAQLMERLRDPAMVAFALTHLLFMGWLAALAGWRYLLLALGAMLPNVLVTTGGAELNGWSTHYHAMYLPFVIFAASVGFARLLAQLRSENGRAVLALVCAVLAVGLARFYDPYNGRFTSAYGGAGERALVSRVYQFYVRPEKSPDRAMLYWIRMLGEAIPSGSKLSTVEGAMPMLYRSNSLALFPVGMDEADYLVLAGVAENGSLGETTSFRHGGGAAESNAVNQCLQERMVRQGFVLDREIRGAGLVLLRRSHS